MSKNVVSTINPVERIAVTLRSFFGAGEFRTLARTLGRRELSEKKSVLNKQERATTYRRTFRKGRKVMTPEKMHLSLSVSAALAAFLLVFATSALQAAPKADLWPRWQKHDPSSSKTIEHGAWNKFLEKYLVAPHPSGINRLRYSAVTREDREILQAYIKNLEQVPVSTYNRAEQKAYWINLYNALTVEVVLSRYPVASIRDINISPGFFSRGPWGAKLVTVEGEKLSLDDIEHRILRPIWKDNRVHYAVNCASIGCPNLQPMAYTSENMEMLLEKGAREYINHPRGASLYSGSLQVSSIYVWFQEDFGDSTEGVLNHLRKYANPPLAKTLHSYRGRLAHDYDWRLNAPEPELQS